MSRPLGVNLSFCVKRWVTPALWCEVVGTKLECDLVQLSFDLVDPMWPQGLQAKLASETRRHAAAHGIAIHSAFIGLAHYTFNQLLHPEPAVRDYAEAWLVRAMDFAAQAGIPRIGGPLGAIASRPDGSEADAIAEADYGDLVARMRRLAEAAQARGLAELMIEPTPMKREWPWTVAQAKTLMADLQDTPVPWTLCVDWGHGTYEPLYGRGHGEMRPWLETLAGHIGAVHLQQTDYQLDRHWDFTQPGRVDPAAAARLLDASGLADRPTFLEVFYPFERDDASVLDAMTRSMATLRRAFAAAP